MRRHPLTVVLVPVLALLLGGCVAETVRKAKPRKGGIKEIGYVDLGGGEVRYSLDGWGWFVGGRRRAARALMRHVCGKLKPVVTEEFEREDVDVPYSQDDIAATMARGSEHFTVARYMHMAFDCAYSSTAPVRGEPPRGLPPPLRFSPAGAASVVAAPVEVSASSAAVGTAVAVSSVPAPVPAVQFSSAPARPAITSSSSGAAPPSVPPAAAIWTPFASSWSPVQASPKSSTSTPAAISTSPATSEVKRP